MNRLRGVSVKILISGTGEDRFCEANVNARPGVSQHFKVRVFHGAHPDAL